MFTLKLTSDTTDTTAIISWNVRSSQQSKSILNFRKTQKPSPVTSFRCILIQNYTFFSFSQRYSSLAYLSNFFTTLQKDSIQTEISLRWRNYLQHPFCHQRMNSFIRYKLEYVWIELIVYPECVATPSSSPNSASIFWILFNRRRSNSDKFSSFVFARPIGYWPCNDSKWIFGV
jgi:hypothetical protein